ncbi:thiamine pyrophosphate-binding protein [Sphingomonas sp. KC8]|uniref:thiamine pyrophosphate-binding protein n=1 Tax=Sphingomonas sp. KC8 TaxID=1030157 RepID=UPI0002489C80|nr:thiamine pyrophosphate-binding protein [Sphingomonas sp. KC8]ARS27255.1 putative acetolactate synthase large subunit [Sphingomonas sp. KC8]
MTETITGGEAARAALEALGVECVFGIPSQHNLALYEALSRSNQIRTVGARNEAGAVHAADGYARATGKLGVAIVSTGPGTSNAVTGLYEAGYASSPVMLITTQVDRPYLDQCRGYIHDAPGQLAMLQSVTRRTERPLHAQDIAPAILRLAGDILSGRPQPGAIEIPTDLLKEPTPVVHLTAPAIAVDTPKAAAIEAAAALIAKARRPLIWLGGGCVRSGAEDAVRAFVDHIGAPVVTTVNGRSAIPSDHPLVVGSSTHYPQARPLFEDADLVIAVGTRFQAVATGFWTMPIDCPLIQIDIDASLIGRNYPVTTAIVGDAGVSLEALRRAASAPRVDPEYGAAARDIVDAIKAESAKRIGPDHVRLCDALDAVLPTDRIVVSDATMVGNTWASFRLPVRDFRGYTYSTSLAIGPALPLAIGAAIGSGRRTIAVHGDGGVMLNIGELATAVEARAPMTLLVFNNQGYGVLKLLQGMQGLTPFACDLHTPDFVGLGKAMGMPAERVDTVEGFEAALRRSIAIDGPSLIEVDISGMAPVGL